MATTISTEAPVVTLINVFTVDPGEQSELVRLLDEATETVMRHRPGFVSANIHAGLDGVTVANYAQWRSEEDFEAMLADPVAKKHMAEVTSLAKVEPRLYTVVSTHGR